MHNPLAFICGFFWMDGSHDLFGDFYIHILFGYFQFKIFFNRPKVVQWHPIRNSCYIDPAFMWINDYYFSVASYSVSINVGKSNFTIQICISFLCFICHWWPTSIGDRNSLRGKYYPNLLIRHRGSQRIYISLNRWVVNSAAPGNSLARSGLSVATVL
jgi:hypothetical protein